MANGILSNNNDGDEQAGTFYREVLSEEEKDRLTSNIAGNLSGAQEFIQKRVIANFSAADADYGARIARKISAIKAKKGKTQPTATP